MTLHTWTAEELPQGSDEWLAARCGVLTASTIGKLISVGIVGAIGYGCPDCGAPVDEPCLSKASKTPKPISTFHPARHDMAAEVGAVSLSVADNETSRSLMLTLAGERLTGRVDPVRVTPDMWRGTEEEPIARAFYETAKGVTVDEVGFMVREDDGVRLGYSPDGQVGDDGLIEIKSRLQKKHVQTVLDDAVPVENMAQIMAGLFVSGREWCDYVSFSAGMEFWTKRVEPDPIWFGAIARAAAWAEGRIAGYVDTYRARTEGLPVTEPRIDLDEMVI